MQSGRRLCGGGRRRYRYQSESMESSPREIHEMDLEDIKEVIYDCDIELIREFINNEAVLNKFVNSDPRVFYEILSSAVSVNRRRLLAKNVCEIYEDLVVQLIRAAKEVHFGLFDGKTVLMSALDSCMSYKVIDELIKAGSDINAPLRDMSPLMHAINSLVYVEQYDVDFIIKLINRGADVNCRDSCGWTPLFYSMFFFRPDLIVMLLKAGLSVNDVDYDGRNCLMPNEYRCFCHCFDGSNCVVKGSINTLLQYGVSGIDLTKHINNEGNTILHTTLCLHTFELAIKCGVSIEAKNNYGRTPLLKEVQTRNVNKFAYLLKLGANVNSTDSELQTALHLCAANVGHFPTPSSTLDMLIYHGANMYARNSNNQTPLDVFVNSNGNYWVKDIIFAIPMHIILFDDNGFDFEKKHLGHFYGDFSGRASSYIGECKKELTLMRESFIADGVTFYEFCILKRYYKSKCVNISPSEYKYRCSEVRQLFPIYGNIIVMRIKDNRLKKRELDLRKGFEKIILNQVHTRERDIDEALNYDCLYHICRYLNYEEMFNIFSAAVES